VINTRLLSLCLVLVIQAAISTAEAGDVETITRGREVNLEAHLIPGKYVLFDFYADWCGPCRALEPHLLDLADRHADRLSVRKVDIINWDSAVSRQYRVSSVPFLVLYGPDGERLAAGDAGSVLQRLMTALGDGGHSPVSATGRPSIVPLLLIAAIFAVTIALFVRRRTTPARPANATVRPAPVDTAADPADPAIWFTLLQGSMEGPFTKRQLTEMRSRGDLEADSEIRRRGDASWSVLADVID
jgi:thiol-disulfide isomerase/thioredoxin